MKSVNIMTSFSFILLIFYAFMSTVYRLAIDLHTEVLGGDITLIGLGWRITLMAILLLGLYVITKSSNIIK